MGWTVRDGLNLVGVRDLFSTVVHNGPEAASSKMDIESFPQATAGAWRSPPTPSSAKVKNWWNYTSAPPLCVHWHVTGRPLPLHVM